MSGGGSDGVEVRAMRDAWATLREEWGLDQGETRALLQGDDGGVTLDGTVETRMRILLAIGYRLETEEDLDAFRARLRRPTSVFGWFSPLAAMSGPIGRLRAVRSAIEDAAWL